jgi:3-hydroxybutyryl-CoA dehydrogenase
MNIENKNTSQNIPPSGAMGLNVAIIGSGTMGSGIAQVAATAGCKVKVVDSNPDALAKSAKNLENTLSKLVEKNKIDETEKSRIIGNFSYVSSVKELVDTDLVIEAIVENLEVKKKLFAELETIVSAKAILASNTSSLSIASIASACKNAERVIGIHFFNPAPLMNGKK